MSKMIQIRNVPDDLHRRLKVRAADAGTTLSEYLLRMAEREASCPTIGELSARIRSRGRARLTETPAVLVRGARDRA